MSFYSDQADQFLQMKAAIQTRLTNEGKSLDQQTYANLGAKRDELADQADAMIADDVLATLAKLKLDQPRIANCTASLNKAVKNIKRLDQVLAIAAAGVTLAAAIASADPIAIGQALVGAEKAVATAVAKPAVRGDGIAMAASGSDS
jgi:hypothetical protein